MLAGFGDHHPRGTVIGVDPALLSHGRGFVEHLVGDGPHVVGLGRPDNDGPRWTAFHRPEHAEL